jgi:hypothetical protein
MFEEDYKYSSAANPAPIHYAVDQQNLQGPGASLRYYRYSYYCYVHFVSTTVDALNSFSLYVVLNTTCSVYSCTLGRTAHRVRSNHSKITVQCTRRHCTLTDALCPQRLSD